MNDIKEIKEKLELISIFEEYYQFAERTLRFSHGESIMYANDHVRREG